MNLVVDASIALKWFVAEDDSDAALAARIGHTMIAPDLLPIECRNAFLNKIRRRELSVAAAQRLERDLDAIEIEILPTAAFLSRAFAIAIELGEPIYDCIYVAMAVATERVFLTADKEFASVVGNSSLGRERVVLLANLAAGR
jgi:predicted nucleic acid-binding protein